MSDANEIVQKYFEAWNDFDADHRKATLEALFTENADIVDPDWTAENRKAIVAAIGEARTKLGDLTLGLTRMISAHNDLALYSWYLGEGTPVATGYGMLTLHEGRIRHAYNFFG